jgi:hypothetical protein
VVANQSRVCSRWPKTADWGRPTRGKARLRPLATLCCARFAPAEFYREVSVVCRSHDILLLSQACLAQSPFIPLSPILAASPFIPLR